MDELVRQAARSEAFYRHVAPNMDFVYLMFWAGIGGLLWVLARCAGNALGGGKNVGPSRE